MTRPKRNPIVSKTRKQPDIQRKFKAYRKLNKDGREGGRCLFAITSRKDLSAGEKLVLIRIGAAHDYRSRVFTSAVPLSLELLCGETSQSPSGVRKITKQLEAKGLLIVTRRKDSYGADCPNHYQLTWKLFKDYIKSKFTKRLENIAAIPEKQPDPNDDGPGQGFSDQPEPAEEPTSPEPPQQGLRLVHSMSASSIPLWGPEAMTGWGGSVDIKCWPTCEGLQSEGESAASEPGTESIDELPTSTDTLTDPMGALSEGMGLVSEPLFPSSFLSSSKEELNPKSKSLRESKGQFLVGQKPTKHRRGNSVRMDILYKEMRKVYRDFTPGEITRGIVAEMILAVPDKELVLASIREYVIELQGCKVQYRGDQDDWWVDRIKAAAASNMRPEDGDPGPVLMPFDDDEYQNLCG